MATVVNVKSAPYSAVGNGVADDSLAVQQALVDAHTNASLVYFPNGTYLVGNLGYRNQSLAGPMRDGQAIIRSKPGADIFTADQSLSAFTRARFSVRNLQFQVDDTVDASGSFARGGVGNAAFAYQQTDNSLSRLKAGHALFHNITITSTSGTAQGRNNSCGFYDQAGMMFGRVISSEITRLKYGWYMNEPEFSLTAGEWAADHNLWHAVRVDGCGTGMRLVNVSHGELSSIIITSCDVGLEMAGFQSLQQATAEDMAFEAVFIEDSITTPLVMVGVGHRVGTMRIQGPHGTVAIGCSSSNFDELYIATLSGTNTPPVLTVTGHRNRINLQLAGTSSADYKRNLVTDSGRGNTIAVNQFIGSTLNQPLQINRDGRTLHERDAASILLGYTSTPFVSGKDLLVNPLSITPTGDVEDTDFSWVADTATDLGHRLRILGTACDFFAQTVNGPGASFIAGEYLPPGRFRVYVKAKVATGGTQAWYVKNAVSAVTLGSGTLTWTTSYTVGSFDVDMTGIGIGTALQLSADAMGGGGAGPLDIAWVAFRPWQNDLLMAGSSVMAPAALATNATSGFLYIPTCAGTPTGTPAAQTGTVPIVWDSTNNKLYVYDGGWIGGTAPGVFS